MDIQNKSTVKKSIIQNYLDDKLHYFEEKHGGGFTNGAVLMLPGPWRPVESIRRTSKITNRVNVFAFEKDLEVYTTICSKLKKNRLNNFTNKSFFNFDILHYIEQDPSLNNVLSGVDYDLCGTLTLVVIMTQTLGCLTTLVTPLQRMFLI